MHGIYLGDIWDVVHVDVVFFGVFGHEIVRVVDVWDKRSLASR